MSEHRKIVIIGAGHVGSHIAQALCWRWCAQEIVLVDKDSGKAAAQAMDVADSLSFPAADTTVRAGGYGDCADADLVFIAIGKGNSRFFAQRPYDPQERFADGCCTSPARFAWYADRRREEPCLRTNAASYRWILESLQNCDAVLKPENLRRVRTPTLVIRAELDALVRPEGQDAFLRGVPCAQLYTVPNVKHEIYRSTNEQLLPYLAEIFRFLEKE